MTSFRSYFPNKVLAYNYNMAKGLNKQPLPEPYCTGKNYRLNTLCNSSGRFSKK